MGVLSQERLEHIRQQLAMLPNAKRGGANRIMVCCPYHGESNPSAGIWTEGPYAGLFRCFACKARAKWDEVAPKLGLKAFYDGPPREENTSNLLMSRLKQVEAATSAVDAMHERGYREEKLKFSRLAPNKKWRTIPTNLLLELGGKMCVKYLDDYNTWSTTKFIYLPVMIRGEQRGYFRARLKKDESGKNLPSYLLAPGTRGSNWSSQDGLWPYDHAIGMMKKMKSKTVVLVEGQRDALRLILAGIPAMCIFGTQSWSTHKARHLSLGGVKRVVLFMDGDAAGFHATEHIKPSLKNEVEVRALSLWKMKGSPLLPYLEDLEIDDATKAAKKDGVTLWDPGCVPDRIINRLREKYFE
ncbi:DNA primase [Burkholderia phage BcepSauron]|uniref:DNA primase n=1 Tax=Burkholderia phage BcepSauron TaxID=2530033 RepID=A0A482MLT1_9CAUD|nr:DNA primase [Burkholderia phage BcepSauron]QBQ74608.1 DNA primase [Burkholderia phage BcepSauron]